MFHRLGVAVPEKSKHIVGFNTDIYQQRVDCKTTVTYSNPISNFHIFHLQWNGSTAKIGEFIQIGIIIFFIIKILYSMLELKFSQALL